MKAALYPPRRAILSEALYGMVQGEADNPGIWESNTSEILVAAATRRRDLFSMTFFINLSGISQLPAACCP